MFLKPGRLVRDIIISVRIDGMEAGVGEEGGI